MESATIDRHVVEIEGPREGSLEARASLALKILGFLGIAGVVLAMFPPATPVGTLFIVMFNLGAAALAALLLGVAVGLARRRPWAVAAVRPLLVFLIASGAFTLAIALSEGRIRVPFDVALATWALLGSADVKPVASLERRSTLFLGAAAALAALMTFGNQLFDWGGVFDVHEPDLRASLRVDCGAPGAGLAPSVTITYDWSWGRTTPLPSGIDIVVIGWTGADAEGRPLYVIEKIPDSAEGIYSGLGGYPSTTMASQIATESEGSFRWGIVLVEQRYEAGHIELQLMLAREVPPGPNPLTITASYIHLGLWRHAATSVTCSW